MGQQHVAYWLSLSIGSGLVLMQSGCKGPENTPAEVEDTSEDVTEPVELDTIRVVVGYEEGAAPYTGSAGPGQGELWSLFESNSASLLEGTGLTVTATSELTEMTALPADDVNGYDVDALLALAEQVERPGRQGDTRTVVALWVDGQFMDNGVINEGVLGVSIGDTSVVAMFKPVIEGMSPLDGIRRFGEQAVLIHEFGHAMGLVNRGVPLTTGHQDEERGAHCINDRCVMYWALEGASDVVDFVQNYAVTNSTVLFDDDCLADSRAWYSTPGSR